MHSEKLYDIDECIITLLNETKPTIFHLMNSMSGFSGFCLVTFLPFWLHLAIIFTLVSLCNYYQSLAGNEVPR